jgi:hypothetical protein
MSDIRWTRVLKDIAPEALKKPVCRIWLKIDILVDLEVLNKV